MNLSDLNKLSGVVELTERIVLTLTEEENHLECKATLVADCAKFEPKEKVTYRSPGFIEIDANGKWIRVDGLNLHLKSETLGFVTGLVIKNANGLIIDDSSFSGASLWGVELRNCKNVEIYASSFNRCKHGGLCISGCYKCGVYDCEFVDNGIDPPNHGYGVTLSSAEDKTVNNVVILGRCFCRGNMRKGIDVHCGTNVNIDNCYAENVADGGIYAVCESESKYVSDVKITDCTVEQASKTPSAFGIAVGCTSELNRPTPKSGTFVVDRCVILSRPESESLSGIHVYMPSIGSAPDNVTITHNIIRQKGKPGRSCGISLANAAEIPGAKKPKIRKLEIIGNTVEMTGQSSCGISAGSFLELSCYQNTVRCNDEAYAAINVSGDKITDDNNRVSGKFSFAPKRVVVTKKI